MIITKTSHYPSLLSNPEGEVIQELLGLQAGGATGHSLAKITIPAGKASEAHFHKKSEESYLILSGSATMVIDGEKFDLKSGEAVLIEPMEVHQIANSGNDDLAFLAVCVPAWQPDDSYAVS